MTTSGRHDVSLWFSALELLTTKSFFSKLGSLAKKNGEHSPDSLSDTMEGMIHFCEECMMGF